MRVLFPIFLFVLLAGCASLSQEECVNGDWQAIGQSDARLGYRAVRLGDHTKACARYQIIPDASLYQQGYKQGLVHYCTVSNGFRVGRNGYRYKGICPAGLEEGFLSGYNPGREIDGIETSIAQVENDINQLERDMSEMRFDSNIKDRREQLRRLDRQRDRLRDERRRLERELEAKLAAAEIFLQRTAPDL